MHVYHIGRDFIFLLYSVLSFFLFIRWTCHTRYVYAQCSNKTVTLFNIAWNCCEVRVCLSFSLSLLRFLFPRISYFFSLLLYYLLPQPLLECTPLCNLSEAQYKFRSSSQYRNNWTKKGDNSPNRKKEKERASMKKVAYSPCQISNKHGRAPYGVLFALISIEFHLIFGHF